MATIGRNDYLDACFTKQNPVSQSTTPSPCTRSFIFLKIDFQFQTLFAYFDFNFRLTASVFLANSYVIVLSVATFLQPGTKRKRIGHLLAIRKLI